MHLPVELVIGSWAVIRTEIPHPYEIGSEFYHFSADGLHYWEYPFLDQKKKIWRFRYTMTDHGVHITPTGSGSSNGWILPLDTEGDLLVITSPRGY